MPPDFPHVLRTVNTRYHAQIMERPVFMPAEEHERFMVLVLMLPLTVIWGAYIYRRVLHHGARRAVVLLVAMLLLWEMYRIVKMPEDGGASPWRIARILLKDGLLAMVFVDPQHGHVVRIMSMVSPLGDIETIIRNALGGMLLASAADGEQGERTAQPALMQLFQRLTDEALNASGLKGEVEDGFVRDGVRYTVKVSKTMGFWFTAELEGMKKL